MEGDGFSEHILATFCFHFFLFWHFQEGYFGVAWICDIIVSKSFISEWLQQSAPAPAPSPTTQNRLVGQCKLVSVQWALFPDMINELYMLNSLSSGGLCGLKIGLVNSPAIFLNSSMKKTHKGKKKKFFFLLTLQKTQLIDSKCLREENLFPIITSCVLNRNLNIIIIVFFFFPVETWRWGCSPRSHISFTGWKCKQIQWDSYAQPGAWGTRSETQERHGEREEEGEKGFREGERESETRPPSVLSPLPATLHTTPSLTVNQRLCRRDWRLFKPGPVSRREGSLVHVILNLWAGETRKLLCGFLCFSSHSEAHPT